MMTKILFVCHGNICRSPMAQYVMQRLVNDAGLENKYEIDSAATSTEEIGNPVYPPVKFLLAQKGYCKIDHKARQVTMEDYRYFDKIYVMDKNNVRNILRIVGNDPDGKVSLLLGDTEIEDPWYTDNYAKVYDMILKACKQLLP